MPKNLVLLHVDCLSHQMFWQYRRELPNLWSLREKSFYFGKCHA